MLGILVWNSVRQFNDSHAKLLQQYAREKSTLLATFLGPALAANDRATVLDLLGLLHETQNQTYIVIYNHNYQLVGTIGNTQTLHKSTGKVIYRDESFEEAKSDGVIDIKRDIYLAGQLIGTLYVGYPIRQVNELALNTRIQNSIIALIAITLSTIITVLIGLFLTRSLRRLEEGAVALKEGNLAHRIDIDSHDEIGDVARSFNTMAQHLESTQRSLQLEHSALELETRRMETLLNGVNAVVFEATPYDRRFTYVSQEAENLLGYKSEEWLEANFWKLHLHPDDWGWSDHVIKQQMEQRGDFTIDFRMLHHSGDYLWVRSIHSMEEYNGGIISRGLLIDINEQKKTEERIIYLADHDALTGLYNRRRFQEEIDHQIAYARRFEQPGALLFVDLDQFKYINDTFGHQAGDECLLTVSRCLSESLRSIDILGRLGGDEFGVILPHTNAEDAQKVSRHLLEKLGHETLLAQGMTAPISASIGIAVYPDHGITPSELLAKADAAMYAAKRQGRNQYHLYMHDDETLLQMKAKVHWEDKIHRALSDDRFLLQYQPIVDLQTREAIHYEVLLRLEDEDGNYIYPHAFLDTAEHFGLILEIDKWVMRNAIRIQGESVLQGRPLTLAINISGRSFGNSELLKVLRDALVKYNANPENLIFEVTETAALENFTRARSFIESLRSMGCRFALDDFGVGYSSFNYLRNLPVDMIKIDGSFVRNLHLNQFDRIIVKAISDVSDGLAVMTIAEFVENEEIRNLLLDLGIRYGQGYHLAMPDELLADGPIIAAKT